MYSYVQTHSTHTTASDTHAQSADLDEGLLGESLVDLWSVGDVLGPVGIVQRGEGLLDVAHGGTDRGNDGGLGPATQ